MIYEKLRATAERDREKSNSSVHTKPPTCTKTAGSFLGKQGLCVVHASDSVHDIYILYRCTLWFYIYLIKQKDRRVVEYMFCFHSTRAGQAAVYSAATGVDDLESPWCAQGQSLLFAHLRGSHEPHHKSYAFGVDWYYQEATITGFIIFSCAFCTASNRTEERRASVQSELGRGAQGS